MTKHQNAQKYVLNQDLLPRGSVDKPTQFICSVGPFRSCAAGTVGHISHTSELKLHSMWAARPILKKSNFNQNKDHELYFLFFSCHICIFINNSNIKYILDLPTYQDTHQPQH